jgi:hypothetical protein
MSSIPLHGHPQPGKLLTPSPLTLDDSNPHDWGSQAIMEGRNSSQQEGSGSGMSDISTCAVPDKRQEYTFWSGQRGMWSCDAGINPNSRSSSRQQPPSELSPPDDDSEEYFGDEQKEGGCDPLLSKLPADLLNVLASGSSTGQLTDVTNNFAA